VVQLRNASEECLTEARSSRSAIPGGVGAVVGAVLELQRVGLSPQPISAGARDYICGESSG
jgi:hypothetical protein